MNKQHHNKPQSSGLGNYRHSLFALPYQDAGADQLTPGDMLQVASEQLNAMVIETSGFHVLGHYLASAEDDDKSPATAIATTLAVAMQAFEVRVMAVLDLVDALRKRMPAH